MRGSRFFCFSRAGLLLLGLFVGGIQLVDLRQHGGGDVERRVRVDQRRGVEDQFVLLAAVDLLHGAVQQVLGAVGEHVVLLVERLGLLLGVALVGGHLLLDALLLCLRVARGDQSLFVLLLQLGGFGLEVLFALRPALLRLLGLLLKRYAFVLVEVAESITNSSTSNPRVSRILSFIFS